MTRLRRRGCGAGAALDRAGRWAMRTRIVLSIIARSLLTLAVQALAPDPGTWRGSWLALPHDAGRLLRFQE